MDQSPLLQRMLLLLSALLVFQVFIVHSKQGETLRLEAAAVKNALTAPSGFTAVAKEDPLRVELSWQPSTLSGMYYLLYKEGDGRQRFELTTTTYIDQAVTRGQTYGYWVEACSSSGCSAPTAQIDVTIPTAPILSGSTTTTITTTTTDPIESTTQTVPDTTTSTTDGSQNTDPSPTATTETSSNTDSTTVSPDPIDTTTATTEPTTTDQLQETTPVIPAATMSLLSNGVLVPTGRSVTGTVKLYIKTTPARAVHTAVLDPRGSRTVLTAERLATDGTAWSLDWWTNDLPNGTYQLQVLISDSTYERYIAHRREVEVLQVTTTAPLPTTSATTEPLSAEPTPTRTVTTATPPPTTREQSPTTAPVPVTVAAPDLSTCSTPDLCRSVCERSLANCVEHVRAAAPYTSQTIAIVLGERTGARSVIDTDGDGLTDYDEVTLYLTDPDQADTDGDGVSDGEEVLRHTDPRVAQNTNTLYNATIRHEDPRVAGTEVANVLETTHIDLVPREERPGAFTFVASGRALPNSIVTIYLFSRPVVVSVKAGPDGGWRFEFNEELTDGSHILYAAVTDSGGAVVAKSTPFPFVKEANAVTAGSIDVERLARSTTAPAAGFGFLAAQLLIGVTALILLFLLLYFGLRTPRTAQDMPAKGDETPDEQLRL